MDDTRRIKLSAWYWVAAFVGLMLFQYVYTMATEVAQIPYSTFESYLEEGRIAEVAVSDRFIGVRPWDWTDRGGSN